jgi:UDP-glucose 4-epimerase
MSKIKILITGGAGFIPSSLADKLSENIDNELVLVDNLLTGKLENVPPKPNVKFIKADVNNYEEISEIMLTHSFDVVFHYAAVAGVKRTLENPLLVLNDIKGFENIFRLAKNTGVKRIFFSSSSEVYGEPVEFPQNEITTPLNARLPYAVVKNIGECYCKTYYKEYGLPYTILRFFNTYGPKQSTDFVMSKFIRSALKNEPITVYGDGSQTRTFCYIEDNIDFTIQLLEKNLGINEIFNVGNRHEITILELAQKVKELTGSSSEIVHLPPLKEGDMTRRQPDTTKMQAILNRETPLEIGMKKVIEHIKKTQS